MIHCENGDVTDIVTKELIAAGKTDVKYHLEAHPREIEAEASGRAIAIAGVTRAKLYIVHMSCQDSVMEMKLGRERGYKVMGETCTHHMNVDYNAYEGMEVKGWPVRTILRGKSIVVDDEWKQEKGAGQFIKRHEGEFL